MIGVLITEGLGNQMFQYAAGRSMALQHGTDLALDLSTYGRLAGDRSTRPFELDRFNIRTVPHSYWRDFRFILARRRQRPLKALSGWHVVRENAQYDSLYNETIDESYLFGWWQSWRYFEKYKDQIAIDFQPIVALNSRNIEIQARMRARPSVSVHVRRGDYLNPTYSFIGVQTSDYYEKAIKIITDIEPEFDIYFFSDDLEWCRDEFRYLNNTKIFVDWNRGSDSWQDMFVMSACRHAVIANSTFSWWGAWLGDLMSAPNRMVVAPKRRRLSLENSHDLSPLGWTII